MPTKYLKQCYILQQALFDARDKVVEPTDIATLASAWCRLNEQRRIMRGRPLPGTLRPTDAKKPKRRARALEPAQPEQPTPDDKPKQVANDSTRESAEPHAEPLGPPLPEPMPDRSL